MLTLRSHARTTGRRWLPMSLALVVADEILFHRTWRRPARLNPDIACTKSADKQKQVHVWAQSNDSPTVAPQDTWGQVAQADDVCRSNINTMSHVTCDGMTYLGLEVTGEVWVCERERLCHILTEQSRRHVYVSYSLTHVFTFVLRSRRFESRVNR